jgi:hypothetical protein
MKFNPSISFTNFASVARDAKEAQLVAIIDSIACMMSDSW